MADLNYELVPDPTNDDDAYWCVRLTEGPFRGLIYKYGKIGLKADDNETLSAKFEYDILFVPEKIRKLEFPDELREEFETYLGDIMMEMIQQQIETGDDEDGPNRDDNPEKFVVRRRVYPEGDPFRRK